MATNYSPLTLALRPKVTVVIPVFNRVDDVGRALDSVLAQTFRDFEIVVVDDGSTDGSADFVASRGSAKVRLIRLPDNRGAAAARNAGVAAATGRYVAFLDSDDTWEPEKLALQLTALDQAAAPFLACSTDFYLWHAGRRTPVRTGMTPAKFRKDILFGCSISPGSTLMVDREAFEKVGPFNESLRRLEDWDWLLRYIEHGEMLFVPQPLAHVHVAPADAARAEPDPVLQAIYAIGAEHLPRLQKKGGLAPRQFESSLLIEIAARMYRQNRPFDAIRYVLASLAIYPFRNQAFFRALWRAVVRLAWRLRPE
jgi:glycosyltransferase involved in cell wall biosynthesis